MKVRQMNSVQAAAQVTVDYRGHTLQDSTSDYFQVAACLVIRWVSLPLYASLVTQQYYYHRSHKKSYLFNVMFTLS